MKNKIKSVVLGLSLLASVSVCYAQDFDKGVAAYDSGDFATALREWRPLAAQGYASAQSNLGLMYRKGEGVIQDDKEAVKWYELAAAQGLADAQISLGLMYANGEGVIQDDKEAVRLYGLAAAQGHASAQYNLGLMYANGEGVIQDNVYAHVWFNIASSKNDTASGLFRDQVASIMTASQLDKAQDLARECVKKNYKGC